MKKNLSFRDTGHGFLLKYLAVKNSGSVNASMKQHYFDLAKGYYEAAWKEKIGEGKIKKALEIRDEMFKFNLV